MPWRAKSRWESIQRVADKFRDVIFEDVSDDRDSAFTPAIPLPGIIFLTFLLCL
jgi:hypothetical protein